MTDPDVEREIDANEQRAREADQAENDDGPVVDTLGNIVTPFTQGSVNDQDDAEGGHEDKRSLIQKAKDAARTPD